MTKVNIPDSVISIVEDASSCCRCISVTLPNSVFFLNQICRCSMRIQQIEMRELRDLQEWKISDNAFESNDILKNVTIPDSVTEIGKGAFTNCMDLTDIYYSGTAEQRAAISNEADVPDTAAIYYAA